MEELKNAKEKTISNPTLEGVVRDDNNEVSLFIIKYSDSYRPYYFTLTRDEAQPMIYHGIASTKREIIHEVSDKLAIKDYQFSPRSTESGTRQVQSKEYDHLGYSTKSDIFREDPGKSLDGITFISYRQSGRNPGIDVNRRENHEVLMIPSTQPKPERYRRFDMCKSVALAPIGLTVEVITTTVFMPIAAPLALIAMSLGYHK